MNILSKLTQENKVDTKAFTEQIKQLSQLKDEGFLTEEEYSEKEKELLSKL